MKQISASAETVGAIDCHAHFMPKPYEEALVRAAQVDPALQPAATRLTHEHPARFPLVLGGIDHRLQLMDAAGIAVQLLSMASPFLAAEVPDVRAKLVRTWNDAAADVASRHAQRFRVFASVPLPDVDGAVAEVERVGDRDTTIGWFLNTHPAGWPIDDPRLEPLYDAWNRRGAVVFVHPDRFCVRGLLDDHGMDWDIGTQFDDTIAAVRLYASGILERYTGIRWIVAHLGGALPFLLGRLDQHWERDRRRRSLQQPPSQALDGMLFDTAGHDVDAIRFGVQRLGAHRVVCGSDFPMVNAADLRPVTAGVAAACGDDDAAVAKILHGNVEALVRQHGPWRREAAGVDPPR